MANKVKRRNKSRRKSNARLRSFTPILAGLLLVLAGWIAWNVVQDPGSPQTNTGTAAESVPVVENSPNNSDALPQTDLEVGAQVGQLASDFTVPTLGNSVYNLASQRGRPAIVFIMAYWCGTCIPEARALARLHEEYGDALSIVALDVDPSSSPEALTDFKEAVGNPDYVWAFDEGQTVTIAYQIAALDTTLIIDPNGVVVYRDAYPSPYDTLKEALGPYLPGAAN